VVRQPGGHDRPPIVLRHGVGGQRERPDPPPYVGQRGRPGCGGLQLGREPLEVDVDLDLRRPRSELRRIQVEQ